MSYVEKLFPPDPTFGNRFDPLQILGRVKRRYNQGGSQSWKKGGWTDRAPSGQVQLCIMAGVLQAMLEDMKGDNVEEGNFGVFSLKSKHSSVSPIVAQVLFDALPLQGEAGKQRHHAAGGKQATTSAQVDALINYNDGPAKFENIQALIDDAINLVKCDDNTCVA